MADSEGDKRPVGRPYKFTNPQELQTKIDAYFGDCDPHKAKRLKAIQKADGSTYWGEEDYITEQKPYVISGLAVHLGTSRRLLLDYQNPNHYNESVPPEVRDELIHAIEAAKDKCEAYAEQYFFSGRATRGVELIMRNGYGWIDRREVDNLRHDPESDLDALDDVAKGKEEMANEAQKVIEAEGADHGDGTDGQVADEGPAPQE